MKLLFLLENMFATAVGRGDGRKGGREGGRDGEVGGKAPCNNVLLSVLEGDMERG